MSNPIKDGGPAFPVEYNPLKLTSHKPSLSSEQCRGMTLRDYFAGQAFSGMMSRKESDNWTAKEVAHDAYAYADAMIKEREVKP